MYKIDNVHDQVPSKLLPIHVQQINIQNHNQVRNQCSKFWLNYTVGQSASELQVNNAHP